MNNDNIKLDIIPQLEVILRSINKDNQDVLKPVLDSDEIDKVEKQEIRKYLKLYDVLDGNISLETLQKEIPGRNFDVEPIEENMLPNYISIYLYNKKNLEASKILLELSSQVRATRLN